jgi:cerevisin
MKGLLGLSLLPFLTAASPVVIDSIHKDAAPILSSINSKEIPDSYIVVFKNHVTSASAAAHHSWVQDLHLASILKRGELRKRAQFPFMTDVFFEGLKHTYDIAGSLLGYSGHFDEDVIEQVRRHPDVSSLVLVDAGLGRHMTDTSAYNHVGCLYREGLGSSHHRRTLDREERSLGLGQDFA